jgi:hypothetical protein
MRRRTITTDHTYIHTHTYPYPHTHRETETDGEREAQTQTHTRTKRNVIIQIDEGQKMHLFYPFSVFYYRARV